jgi:hypothetical protein
MDTGHRAQVNERGFPDLKGLEAETRTQLQLLGPESVLRLVEYICRRKPMSLDEGIVGTQYLVPLLSFVNGVEWTFVFLYFTHHVR